MIKVGITGGIGSGKSVVFNLFKLNNVPAFDSDKEAKIVNDTSPVVKKRLTEEFGDSIYIDGKLDRKQFASIIFASKESLKIANSIIHPALAEHFMEWCKQHENHPLVVMDAAILFEAGFDKYVDKIIAVYAPEEVRIGRVMKRDNTTREKVKERMQHQIPEEEKIKLSDFVIHNDGSQSVIKQTNDLQNLFLEKSF